MAERAADLIAALRHARIDTKISEDGHIELRPLEASIAVPEEQVAALIAGRAAARKAKNFTEADRIRDELDGMGVKLKDSKDPKTGELVTTWEVKR